MLKQSLAQKQLQKLSPQQIQLMKLLQVPTAALEQRIKEEMEINPALEEGPENDPDDTFDDLNNDNQDDDFESQDDDYEEQEHEQNDDFSDYLADILEDDDPSNKYESRNKSPGDEEQKQIPVAVEFSFHEHLVRQLGMLNLSSDVEMTIAHQLIGSIDDDGYLRREPIAIVDDLAFTQNIIVSEEQVVQILQKIQRFDPPGIGARNLQECLILQIDDKLSKENAYLSEEEKMQFKNAKKILKDYFAYFIKKHYNKLTALLTTDDEGLKKVIDLILKLNPKPAGAYVSTGKNVIHYIVPDFIIEYRDGELELTLNSKNAPDLHVSDAYKEMLKAYKDGKDGNTKQADAYAFIKTKLDSAKWFIDAIKQRQDTMYRTMYAILQFQKEFFLSADTKKLRPMILKDIAELTGLDISTVSRVVNSKYVQTEFGTKLLKEFFNEAMQTESGDEVSTIEVKHILAETIEKEEKRKPLSDDALKQILQNKGYQIARRTVAKYREQLNIPVARLRKEL